MKLQKQKREDLEDQEDQARLRMHGAKHTNNKLHHLYGFAYHSPLHLAGLTCCALALGLVAGLHEAEAGAARALEQELHALSLDLLVSDLDLRISPMI